ncbi:MAG: 3-hydroxybutyryl-CoA dehydrogenase [Syntrophorhabdaceae bacterium PtaU1.Bin034]|nr:MAG: 3-hydroxybutyryl-CoA dehydrogenase [Syntrophorhabdaceae bacterium PtaU1.Bin034]
MAVKRIGVVGCGVMGVGIVQLGLQAGYEVMVREINDDLLQKGLGRVRGALDKMAAKGAISVDGKEDMLRKLSGTTAVEALSEGDFIIEAASENMSIKTGIFEALDKLCGPETIFASNTSSLSVSDMAAKTSRPDKFIGLHFFNPAAVMPLVEVIKTIRTEPAVFQTALEFVKSLKKIPVVAKDNAGFIVNLLLTPFLLDAIRALQEGVASVADIDAGMKLGCNHPMGPLMLADFIGIDVLMSGADSLFKEYKEKRYAPLPLMKRMVTLGLLGAKTGKGFYDWSDPKNPKPLDLGL